VIEKMVLEKNLKAIENNANHIILPFDPSKQKYNVFRDKDKVVVACQNDYVRYDNSDTGKYVKNFDYNHKGIYFMPGLFDIGAVERIYNGASRDSIVFVVEPNPEIFYYMLTHYDMADLFARKNFYLLVADYEAAPEYFSNYIINKGFVIKVSNIQCYTSQYLKVFEREQSLNLQKRFFESARSSLFMLGNSTDDTMIGLLQNLLNFKKFCSSMSIRKLKNKYLSTPAVIVSAGPSLKKNIHYLKQADRENVLIFAVDTIIKKLLDMGISPDAVFTVERPKIVYEYFYKDIDFPENTVFVGPPVVYPGILKKFSARRMILPLKGGEKMNNWLNCLVSNKSDLIPNGLSVAHLAFSFARYLGCDPIIFTGQDLAYGDDGRTHSEGTIYDNKDVDKRKEKDLWVEGYFGEQVRTSEMWRKFQTWFEEEFYKSKGSIINSTEGGAKLKHTQNLLLKDALDKYAVKKCKPLYELIDDIYEPLFMEENEVIHGRIENEAEELRKFNELMESFIKKLVKYENNTIVKENIVEYLSELNQMMIEYEQNADGLGFFTIFIQTHFAIASFEINQLKRSDTVEKVGKIIEIQKKLFKVSADLSELIYGELEKYLHTSFMSD